MLCDESDSDWSQLHTFSHRHYGNYNLEETETIYVRNQWRRSPIIHALIRADLYISLSAEQVIKKPGWASLINFPP